jgi:hypothetical protein
VQRPHGAVAGTKEEEVNISQTTLRIGAVLGTIGAIVVLVASAQAATSKPAGMSQPEYRALMIRSEALNKLYGNAATRLSPREFKSLYNAGGYRQAPQEFAALVARSEELNRRYGLDKPSAPTSSGVQQPARVVNGFDWGDFGIGAAAMLGLVLLVSGLIAGSYYGRVPRTRVS